MNQKELREIRKRFTLDKDSISRWRYEYLMRRVVVTGMGAITPIGLSVDELVQAEAMSSKPGIAVR